MATVSEIKLKSNKNINQEFSESKCYLKITFTLKPDIVLQKSKFLNMKL